MPAATKEQEAAPEVEKKERAPRLSAEDILQKRSNLTKLAKASTKEFPTIVEDVEWALGYCPKGTYSSGTRSPATHGTEAGYRRHKDDARRRKEAGVEPEVEHDVFWTSTPCDACQKAHEAHLVEMKKKREVADKQRSAINGLCRKWFREHRSDAVDLVDQAEEMLEEAGGELPAGNFRGFPTLGEDDSTLDDTDIPINVMMAWLAERQEVAKLTRGVWKAIEFSIDAFEEVEEDD